MNTYSNARAFIYRNARPLDLARFQYHFENGSKEAVLHALSYYQNADGGMGHAVEPDCWNPNSIALHSNTAGTLLKEIDWQDASHPVIQGLLRWYTSGTHFDGHIWAHGAVESNNDHPHAPWWHTGSESRCHTNYNGTAQIAGFLVRYTDPGSQAFELGVRVAREAIAALCSEPLYDEHTCSCYQILSEQLEAANVTHLVPFSELKEKLHRTIQSLIVCDTALWSGYVCRPSRFIFSKESEYYPGNEAICDYECQLMLDTQLADGSWPIPWSWTAYPEEWAISKNWWKAQGVLVNLRFLKGFDCLKGAPHDHR